MKILALDTSGPVAAVAIAEDGRLTGGFRLQYKTTHSVNLMPMLDLLRELTELDMTDIDAVAVAEGPGSFTGLRIGAATAKGLADALHVPVIPVPTLEGVAYQMYGTKGLVCPMLDARRSQVYTGIWRFVPEETGDNGCEHIFRMETVLEGCAIAVEDIAERLNSEASGEDVFLLGDGVPVYIEKLRDLLNVPFSAVPFHRDRQSAEAVAALAFRYYNENRAVDPDAFAPVYLRSSQAERVTGVAPKSASEGIIHTGSHRTIRRMTEADIDAAFALEQENFSDPWTKEMLADVLRDQACAYFVSEEADGTVSGLIGLKEIAGEGEITNVSVSGDFRRQGIGRALMTEALDRGRDRGIGAFTLEVRTGNTAARTLYEQCGFVCEGVRPGFYRHPREDAAIYWLREV